MEALKLKTSSTSPQGLLVFFSGSAVVLKLLGYGSLILGLSNQSGDFLAWKGYLSHWMANDTTPMMSHDGLMTHSMIETSFTS